MTRIDAHQHQDRRKHIPSAEEQGYEADNPTVRDQQHNPLALPLNPVVHRGQDPELFWMGKYENDRDILNAIDALKVAVKTGGKAEQTAALAALETAFFARTADAPEELRVDIRSLYRYEHISPEALIASLYRAVDPPTRQLDMFDLFGNTLQADELDKPLSYYTHDDKWVNRLIQGDSLLVMTSLLEREGMAGQVQCIYLDPPYGIKYGSNWQISLHSRDVKDGKDDQLTGQPEQIKAFRDTWELGVHSYLAYLRDRLIVARELLADSGSVFVQISDENVHLVRCIMDEVFGSDNFCSEIIYKKTSGASATLLGTVNDFILWYAKNKNNTKYRQLYIPKVIGGDGTQEYNNVELVDGTIRKITDEEVINPNILPIGSKVFVADPIVSDGGGKTSDQCVTFYDNGKSYKIDCGPNRHWKTRPEGLQRLWEINRLLRKETLRIYKRYFDDFPYIPYNTLWDDTRGETKMSYVVQTAHKVIQRCILMTTDPGDLVLDPTCGSGTTAFVAEQWGRRWLTIDTSRIALHIAKTRLMTARFPFYHLHDEAGGDLRQGFKYKTVPHVTLKSLANDEPAEQETLYDQPAVDTKRMRVAGPFTVETLQSYEPLPPDALREAHDPQDRFLEVVFEHLKTTGVRNGDRNEQAVFARIEPLAHSWLHAKGFYPRAAGEGTAYLHLGPKFGTVSKQAVNEAVKACRDAGDADWLLILGFSFESDIQNETVSMGQFEVTKVRIHDDLLQDGLLKKDKKAASFVAIGEPDLRLNRLTDGRAEVEILGMDVYDPIKDEVRPRSVQDISYWMLDDQYDGSNFIPRQVFFCGGDRDEFDQWKKGLNDLARQSTKKKAEHTLRIELDDEAFARVYGFRSHPLEPKPGQRIAVRVVSQFGEDCTKVLTA